MSKPISKLWQTWYNWKSLRLPWRRRFLIGHDLDGNTYWEFRDIRGHNDSPVARWRRIVQYPRGTHPADVRVPPPWHQWLRHTRREPPSLDEQRNEQVRQQQMRHLAAAADARWVGAKHVDDDRNGNFLGELQQQKEIEVSSTEIAKRQPEILGAPTKAQPYLARRYPPRGPQKQHDLRRAPGQEWQPGAWTPAPKR